MIIKNLYLSNENILIVDLYNRLFIVGSNKNRKTGVENNETVILQPVYLNFDLDCNISIVAFYSMITYIVIHTSDKNLYILNYINKQLNTDNTSNIDKYITVNNTSLQKFNTDFNNFKFITNTATLNENINNNSCNLLESSVENIIVYDNFLFFNKNNNINIFSPNININETIVKKYFGLYTLLIKKNYYNYWQLILPFHVDDFVFCRNFIYFQNDILNHIISVNNCQTSIVWIYFDKLLNNTHKINYKFIDYIVEEMSFYYFHNNDVYKYIHATHQLEYLCGSQYKTKMLETTNTKLLTIFDTTGLYIDNDYIHKCVDYHHLLNTIIDLYITENGKFIIIKNVEQELITVVNNDVYFNIHTCKYYKLYESCETIIYVVDNIMFYCTPNEKLIDSELVNIIKTNNREYFIYQITTNFNKMLSVYFSNNIIVVQTDNDRYSYYYFCTDIIKFDKFIEISNSCFNVTNNEIENYPKIEYTTDVIYNIHLESDKFDKLLNIIECLPDYDVEIKIQYVENKIISHGVGTTHDFFDKALQCFNDKYLINYNNLTEFNLNTMQSINTHRLKYIGILFAYIIMYTESNLFIRLPLNLLAGLKNTTLSTVDLEYFTMRENYEVYTHLSKYKNNPDDFTSLNSGYSNYYSALCEITKYNHMSVEINETIQEISNKIAQGFSELINCRNKNFAQLDKFLSGDYIFSTNLFISKLEVGVYLDHSENQSFYYETFINFLNGMSNNQFANMLQNWSGYSSLCKTTTYTINIVNNVTYDVKFVTCANELNINVIMFDQENQELLLNTITTLQHVIVDK